MTDSMARKRWADMLRALDGLGIRDLQMEATGQKLSDSSRGEAALMLVMVAPVGFAVLPSAGGSASPSRSLALGCLSAVDWVGVQVGLLQAADPDFPRRVLDHLALGRAIGAVMGAVLIYWMASRSPYGVFALFPRNAVPVKCANAIIACALDAGMQRAVRIDTNSNPPGFVLEGPNGLLAVPTVSTTVNAAGRALLRMHRSHLHLAKARRRQIKRHGARVAATLYAAELKIDTSPEEGRRELATMLATISENFSSGKLAALYPEDKLVESPARDWERFRSLGCAVSGVLILWWVSTWGLSGTTGTLAEVVAFAAPFVAMYGPEKAEHVMKLWRHGS
ncbi:hypothetical protein [Kitasatospora sp. NPDC059827]|uniref:hypothetical protein n=1 Tax=Kitasatospora sp. NPDC059827 TaxID=3346964 RepID=UPI00364EACD1